MKPYIIPLFIPHYGCRHQCVFCDQKTITGTRQPVDAEQVDAIINAHLAQIRQPRVVEAAFYGGSFTALPLSRQRQLLEPAWRLLQAGRIQAIRLSTRPDCLQPQIIDTLQRFGVKTVELGVQSLDDQVLKSAGRGHSSAAVAPAVVRLRAAGIACGVQLMPGLPGENWFSLIRTVREVGALQPDFTRLYPTVVLAGTRLADLFQQGSYHPLSLDEAVIRCAYMKLYFGRLGIPVIRTGLQDTEELRQAGTVLAGPFHPAFGELTEAALYYLMVVQCLENAADLSPGMTLAIWHQEREGSKLRGMRNENIHRLKRRFGFKEICLYPAHLAAGQLVIQGERFRYTVNKNMICQI